jgi:DNA repair protein RecO (recombination protein O)
MGTLLAAEAVLLRAVDYRDTDRILTLFTREHGIVSAVARGAKGSKRRFQGVLEPYTLLHVELEYSRGELFTLKRAEVRSVLAGILSDLDRMQAGAGALRLVRELCAPRLAEPALFLALVQYLTLVEHRGDRERGALLVFALRLLALTGHRLGLTRCGRSGHEVPAGRPAYFEPSVGSVVSRRFGGGPFLLGGSVRERLDRAQGDAWLVEAQLPFEPQELAVARSALRAFMQLQAQSDVGACLFPEPVA